jgi:hypothetical protein
MPDSTENQDPQPTSSQTYTEPLAPPPFCAPELKSGSTVLKAVLIVIAIFVGLGVIGAGIAGWGVWHLSKSVHEVPSATFTEKDLGIAIYPDDEPSMTGSRAELFGKTLVSARYFTPDSIDKVIAFYKEEAGPKVRIITDAQGTRLRIPETGGGSITVGIMRFPDASGGKTYIKILHTTQAPGSN